MTRLDMTGKFFALALAGLAGILLGGCAVTAPPGTVPVAAPPQWYAPLPINGAPSAEPVLKSEQPHNASLSSLSQWWQLQNDPLLVELIEAAQLVSPSVITARANIEQAQATRAASEAV